MSMTGNAVSTSPQGPPGPGALTAQAILTPVSSSLQLSAGSFQPVDVRTGPVDLLAPLSPTEGQLFAVFDAYGQTTVNPISVAAQGSGVTIVNPQWNGNGSPYQASATLIGTLGVWRYRFSQALNAWIPDV